MATHARTNGRLSGARRATDYAWSGTVPASWEKRKVAWSFRTIGSGTTPPTDEPRYFDGGIPWVNSADLLDSVIYETPRNLSQDALKAFPALKLYPEGTLLVGMYGQGTIGSLGRLAIEATTNQACCALSGGRLLDEGFVFYWLLGHRDHILRMGVGGGQSNISQGLIRNLSIYAPPVAEQRVIATYLDRETARIDAVIERRSVLQRLISERATSTISHHIEEVDAPVWKLGHLLCRIEQGWSPQCDNRQATADEWGVLKVGCVNGMKFRPEENKALPPHEAVPLALVVKRNDVLMSRANTRDLVGSAALVDTTQANLLLCDKLFRLRTRPDQLDQRYLVYVLTSARSRSVIELEATGASSSMQNIGQDTVKRLPIPFLPLPEQVRVADRIDAALGGLELLKEALDRHVALLIERRQALITAVVTGQIDVAIEAA